MWTAEEIKRAVTALERLAKAAEEQNVLLKELINKENN